MGKIKVLENFVKDLFIEVDYDVSLSQLCEKYNIRREDMIKDQIKDRYDKGDIVIIKKINEQSYTVLPGDNLSKIATTLDCSVSHIIDKNKLKTPVIFVGQRLLY